MSPEALLTICMFGGLILSMMLGVSLAFAMGGVATIAGLVLYGPEGLMTLAAGVFNYMWMLLLAAVPLFVFMGVALAKSGIAVDLYQAFYLWFGRVRGGLAIGSCVFATALSAMTGNCSASTVTAGLVGIPPMRAKKYNELIMLGTIGCSGTLGILIPPSITLIIIGMTTGQSIGKLFTGGLVAGLIIATAFICYLFIRAYLTPSLCPGMAESASMKDKILSLKSVVLPIFIILAVLGTLFFGVATPTEAASVGAMGVVLSVIIRGEFNMTFIKEVSYSTATITGMVLWIMFGAAGFVSIYSGGGGIYFVQEFMKSMNLSPMALFILMQIVVLILGMFLDPMGIILLCLPVFYPIIRELGIDPIWFGIIFQINLCIGYVTPPFGYNLFYLKSLSPETNMGTIYRSVYPFIVIMLICEVLMILFPKIITYFAYMT